MKLGRLSTIIWGNTWQEILTERKRRIDAKKQAIREERQKTKQMREIANNIWWYRNSQYCIYRISDLYYDDISKTSKRNRSVGSRKSEPFDECHDFKVDVMICMNEGAGGAYARYSGKALPK